MSKFFTKKISNFGPVGNKHFFYAFSIIRFRASFSLTSLGCKNVPMLLLMVGVQMEL